MRSSYRDWDRELWSPDLNGPVDWRTNRKQTNKNCGDVSRVVRILEEGFNWRQEKRISRKTKLRTVLNSAER